MNLGIYITNLSDLQQLQSAILEIKNGLHKNELSDASIFYDNIAHNPFEIPCGFFNSTDIWNFSGDLIASSVEGVEYALSIVNHFDLYYYYGWDNSPNIFSLINIVQTKKIKTICRNDEAAKELFRLTGTHPLEIVDDYKNISQLILRYNNERRNNRKNVCRSA